MNCPVCDGVPLKEIDYEGVKVDHCETCDGFWLDEGEIKKINMIHEERFTPAQIAEARELVDTKAIVGEAAEARRIQCPKCGAECRQVSSSGVVIDECPERHGIWLDKGEIDKLQIMAEERSHIFSDEERSEHAKGAERKAIFGRLTIFLHDLFKRE